LPWAVRRRQESVSTQTLSTQGRLQHDDDDDDLPDLFNLVVMPEIPAELAEEEELQEQVCVICCHSGGLRTSTTTAHVGWKRERPQLGHWM